MASALAGRSPFVGRERELAALDDFLAEAAGGRGRVVFIAGEPGIGKSRLLQELSSRARRASWLVLSEHLRQDGAANRTEAAAHALHHCLAD